MEMGVTRNELTAQKADEAKRCFCSNVRCLLGGVTQTRFETLNEPARHVATQAACMYSFTAAVEREIARDVKENRSYNGLDYHTELKYIAAFPKQKTYALPDRNIISVGAGRFHCLEIWFQPSFIGKEACGINDISFHSNMKCHVCIRKGLCDNVVLSSGATIFQGMVERMTIGLMALAPSTMRSRLLLRISMDWRIDLVYELPEETSSLSRRIFPLRGSFVPAKFHWRRSQRIHDTSFRSNMKRDVYIRKELYDVVLSSGTTMLREIVERMTNELTALASFTTKIKVSAPIRYGEEDFLVFSQLPADVDFEGRV